MVGRSKDQSGQQNNLREALFHVTQLQLRYAMARQAPAWRLRIQNWNGKSGMLTLQNQLPKQPDFLLFSLHQTFEVLKTTEIFH
jgi:hypothetical protein